MKQSRTYKQNTLDFIHVVSAFALIAFALRAWPVLLLLIAVLTIAGLYGCWLWIFDEPQIRSHKPLPHLPAPQSPYHQLCQTVNKEILRIFPRAKWVWLTPCPMDAMWDNDFLAVRLYGASGYHRAVVHLVDGEFHRLQVTTNKRTSPATGAIQDTPTSTDYSLMAYQWVESQIVFLNESCNNAIAEKQDSLYLTAECLPDAQSWPDIAKLLDGQGFANEVTENGILLHLQTKGA